MFVADILTPKLVLPELDMATKEEVLTALAERVAACHPEIDRLTLITALHKRERLLSTALSRGVAIPHARVPGVPRMVAALGRSRDGLDCQSQDGEPTHLFFLLVTPAEQPTLQLKMLAAASRLLHEERCRALLLEAENVDAMLRVLRHEERRSRNAA